jgi:tetratricopeptide (TPR) repeat protein
VPDEDKKQGTSGQSHVDESGASDDGELTDQAPAEEVAAAHRVAESLGVGEDDDESAAPAPKEAGAAPNRAARRQEAALRRRQRKGEAAAPRKIEVEEPELPKDKNARAKELLKRRRAQASTARPVQLLPGEMVDDALARGSAAIAKWARRNFSALQWVILGAIAAGGGYVYYLTQAEKSAAAATDTLEIGLSAERGRVLAEDKRSDEEKEYEPVKVFKTDAERLDRALAGYKKAAAENPGTGIALLARLGEAGVYLDQHDWVRALDAYSAVSASTLAAADPEVKARALEGLGFAKEGKGDLDGALASFRELETVDGRGFKELGTYHEARICLAKGDQDKAKDLFKQVHDNLEKAGSDAAAERYVQQMTTEALMRLDPNLFPPKVPAGSPANHLSKEEIQRLFRAVPGSAENKTHGDPR